MWWFKQWFFRKGSFFLHSICGGPRLVKPGKDSSESVWNTVRVLHQKRGTLWNKTRMSNSKRRKLENQRRMDSSKWNWNCWIETDRSRMHWSSEENHRTERRIGWGSQYREHWYPESIRDGSRWRTNSSKWSVEDENTKELRLCLSRLLETLEQAVAFHGVNAAVAWKQLHSAFCAGLNQMRSFIGRVNCPRWSEFGSISMLLMRFDSKICDKGRECDMWYDREK